MPTRSLLFWRPSFSTIPRDTLPSHDFLVQLPHGNATSKVRRDEHNELGEPHYFEIPGLRFNENDEVTEVPDKQTAELHI
jgi:hypothetical protein